MGETPQFLGKVKVPANLVDYQVDKSGVILEGIKVVSSQIDKHIMFKIRFIISVNGWLADIEENRAVIAKTEGKYEFIFDETLEEVIVEGQSPVMVIDRQVEKIDLYEIFGKHRRE